MRRSHRHRIDAVRLPPHHLERMRHDAGPGPKLIDEARLQAVDERWQQVDRDDGCLGNIRYQHIALDERDAIPDIGPARVFARLLDEAFVELDSETARAEFLRGGDDD